MNVKSLLTALVLVTAPSFAAAECMWGMDHQVTMSCADGTTWDAASQTCVPVATS